MWCAFHDALVAFDVIPEILFSEKQLQPHLQVWAVIAKSGALFTVLIEFEWGPAIKF
jgi:hypothetical protein